MRVSGLIFAAAVFACASAEAAGVLAPGATPLRASDRVAVAKPDVELALVGVSGAPEPHADWSASAGDLMLAAIKDIVAAKTHPYSTFDPASLTEDRQVQALLLHDAVRESAIFYHFSAYKLPTKKDGEKDSFDWTIGDGAATIGQAVSADYGVFLRIRGGWSSGARLAMMAVPYVGGSIPRIFQTASVTMVDLKTGKVVWAATASADSGVDIRTPEGAKDFAGKLFADAPL